MNLWVQQFWEGKGHDGVSAPLRIDGALDGGGEGSGVPGKRAVRSAMVEKGRLEVEGGADMRAPSISDWERGEENRWAGGG
jgi:hypothetical protein